MPTVVDGKYVLNGADARARKAETSALVDALKSVGQTPCEKNNCAYYTKCAAEDMCCPLFRAWATRGSEDEKGKKKKALRVPDITMAEWRDRAMRIEEKEAAS